MPPSAADVVVCWFGETKLLHEKLAGLTRPYVFLSAPSGAGVSYRKQKEKLGPHMIHALCAKKFGADFRPLRTALVGFSEGCGGVREALSTEDGKHIDAAFAIDGIHAQYEGGSQKTRPNQAYLTTWKTEAARAVQDGRVCCITASSIVPPYVPVSMCADAIWESVGGGESDDEPPGEIWQAPVLPPFANAAGCQNDKKTGKKLYCWPATDYPLYPTKQYRRRGGLAIWNFANLDPSGIGDHRLQAARVLPRMIESYLVPRWNESEPDAGILLP